MKKERLTIEEIQALPKDAFPFTVSCDDEWFVESFSEIRILSQGIIEPSCIAVVDKHGTLRPFYIHNLSHYPSLKPEPKTKRFYERVGHTNWYSDCGLWLFGIDGARPTSGKLDLSDDIKTGRFFDWDMDANKIVGKVGVE